MQLQTTRATLKLVTQTDFAELLDMYFEPDTFKYIQHLQNRSRGEYLMFLNTRVKLREQQEGYYWVARRLDEGELVGAMNLTPFRDTGILQLGFQIRRKFWNQGYATELAQAVLRFATETEGLEEVYAFYEKENIASGKILKKLGFRFKEEKQFDKKDVPLQVVVYSAAKA